uniref:Synaptic vesicle glycoprotein 2C-like n=1 Tax=Petromyzon marinus TaxID=7757 RepID=A0AAJ7T110_PETMA|nr:synaptic vesicle glycoprotein 2C-like [Petromyzon marinus]
MSEREATRPLLGLTGPRGAECGSRGGRGGRGDREGPGGPRSSPHAPAWPPDGDAEPLDYDGCSHEEALEHTGFGRFHAWLLVACGWANASDAVEILCVSFLLPTARCDLHLSTADMGWLTACMFIGMMMGGCVWGALADSSGRRKVLVYSLAVNGIFSALSSLAPSFLLFLLMRLGSGLGVGGSLPVIFSYFSEFQPRRWRGAMVSALATFWMGGNILAAGLAWLIIPLPALGVWSWRVFVAVCSVPSLTSSVAFACCLPESPKFLMQTGQEEAALAVFRRIFTHNHRSMPGARRAFPVSRLEVSVSDRHAVSIPLGILAQVVYYSRMMVGRLRKMFCGSLGRSSWALSSIFFSISFGYYGLWMWLPELFRRSEEHGGSPCSTPPSNHTDVASAGNWTLCYPVKTIVYMDGFITAAANLPGNILSILLMGRVGGRLLLGASLLLSGGCVFLLWAVCTRLQSLAAACLFSAISVVAWNALDVIGIEMYPTMLRSSALGVFTGVARIAAILASLLFGALLETSCTVPILLIAALLVCGSIVGLCLPETKNSELQ